MPSKARHIYWDSCVFLSYVSKEADRIATIDDLWEEISSTPGSYIVTASLSIVEVAWGVEDGETNALDPAIIEAIDALWTDPNVRIIESTGFLMRQARKLMRDAKPHHWSLKPADAIHLATAEWFNQQIKIIDEFHTYDGRLKKFDAMIGLKISEPYVNQPSLPLPNK